MSITHPKTLMVEYKILLFGIIRLKVGEKIPDTLIVPRKRNCRGYPDFKAGLVFQQACKSRSPSPDPGMIGLSQEVETGIGGIGLPHRVTIHCMECHLRPRDRCRYAHPKSHLVLPPPLPPLWSSARCQGIL